MSRPKCEGGETRECRHWPVWKLREKGDTLERNWFFTCGRHLHRVAADIAYDVGLELELIRIGAT
ncbi:hypothetical protein [Streptomyces sp. NPDC056682]|uniref:hypothetical protein n=1 Tax=Streptomyces sp. NPDC056682 TaxID=3345909 RepID=UPI00369AB547